jgi:hypothetical protein
LAEFDIRVLAVVVLYVEIGLYMVINIKEEMKRKLK